MTEKPTISHRLGLSDEEIDKIEPLAALGYSPEKIAMVLGVDAKLFTQFADDPTSWVNYHIQRGQLLSVVNEELAILTKAQLGDIDASKRIADIRRDRGFKVSKLDVFAGFDSKKTLHALEDYIQSGSSKHLKNEEQLYIETLTLINSMSRKYGRRNTIAFFVKEPFNMKHARVSEMYDEAINLFYSDRNVEKKALRHKYAEELDEAALVVFDNATCAKDLDIYKNIKMAAAKVRGLDEKDPEKLPAEYFRRQFRLFTLSAEDVGLPAINRHEIARQIDQYDIPQSDKIRLRQDARLEQLNLEEYLHELETESTTK